MRLWDESKHPRDNYGKFRKVGLMEGMGENDIDESEENFGERKDGLTLGEGNTNPAPVQKFKPIENMESLKGAPMTHEEANSGKVNPNFGKDGYDGNCQACVAAYYARRLGYNVEALPYVRSNDMMVTLAIDPALAFIDKDGNDAVFNMVDGEDKVQTLSDSLNVGDIAVVKYFISSNKNGDLYHIIIAEKLNNGMRLYDPQTNEVVDNQVINQNIDVDFANIAGYDINKSICREIMRGVKNDK